MDKPRALKKIAKEIESCSICKKGKIGKAVPGEGSADAKIVFVGEAPGKKEAETGRPFVGRSGQLLRSLIKEIGLKEDEVFISKLEKSQFKRSFQSFFITSPVKYLPKYVTPKPSDIAHGKIHFDKQLKIIDPKIIVLLGSVAARAVLGEKIPVIKQHGNVVKRDNKMYFVTLHPAAVLRFQKYKTLMISDFEKLKKLIDKTI